MYINKSKIKKQKKTLKKKGYLRINKFLDKYFAEKIFNCLRTNISWDLSCRLDNESQTFKRINDVKNLGINVQNKLKSGSSDKFKFVYNSYMMVSAYIEKREPELYLNTVLEWLNSKETITYFKNITSNDSIVKINAQATRYLPGHYLSQHNDENISEGRIYAYVLGFSKKWNPEWGGLLHILNKKGNIVKTMIPEYNSLTIFKVPQNHFVSTVTSTPSSCRLSITGWLLSN